jgi:hypothetical protein
LLGWRSYCSACHFQTTAQHSDTLNIGLLQPADDRQRGRTIFATGVIGMFGFRC